MMSTDIDYEASDESSESELMDMSLSVWKGFTNFDAGNDFIPLPLDLHTASSIGNADCIRNIIEQGEEDLNRKNLGGWTALMYACYIGHDVVVNLLLDAMVPVNTHNNHGLTPLMLAASCGNETVAVALIKQEAELEAQDNKGWTALFHATYSGHQNMVRFLIDRGANINAVEPENHLTPFMEAAAAGHEIIVEYFLQSGVDVNARYRSGDTARSLALANGHTKIVSLIDGHSVTTYPITGIYRPESDCLDNSNRRFALLSSTSGETLSSSCIKKSSTKEPKQKVNVDIREGPDIFNRLIKQQQQQRQLQAQQEPTNNIVEVESEDCNAFSDLTALTIKRCSLTAGKQITNIHSSHATRLSPLYDTNERDRLTRVTPQPRLVEGSLYAARQSAGGQQRPSDLASLLRELDLSKYLSVFDEQDVDLQVFLTLTDADLQQIGIKLFGPRRKMTNAIARWHSKARLSGNSLEQAYADKLETEMQEMAIRLHQACEQLERVKLQLSQERELRSVTEACLMKERSLLSRVITLSADNLQKCTDLKELAMLITECCKELRGRISNCEYSASSGGLTKSGNKNTLVAALLEGISLSASKRISCCTDNVSTCSQSQIVDRLLEAGQELTTILTTIVINTNIVLTQAGKVHQNNT